MLIRVEPGRTSRLREPDVFTRLKVVVVGAPDLDLAPLIDCGRLDADRAHVWLDPGWLRAAGPADATWRKRLAGMLDLAGSKGWRDPEGWLRAHIEFESASGAMSKVGYTPQAESAMHRYIGDNQQGKHGKHVYSLEDYGLSKQGVRDHFRGYIERFNIPVKD